MYDSSVNESARRAALVLALLFTPGVARAADGGEPAVAFNAPQGCPDRDAFVAAVRARTRTGALTPKDPRSVVSLEVTVASSGASSLATLTVTDAAGRKGTRRITARSCHEAVDGIALVTALTLDPAGATEPETPLEESPRAKDPEGDQFPKLPLEPAQPAAPAEVREGALPSHLAAGLSMLGLSAPIPGLTPALEISAEARTELGRHADLGFRGALRISKGGELSTSEGVASFEWWALAAGICPGARTATDTLSLALCALVEQGQTHATGVDTDNPRSSRRMWTSFGPGLRGRWALVPRAALEIGADALFPFRRDTFSLGSLQVHEVASVAFRFGAGVAFRFQ